MSPEKQEHLHKTFSLLYRRPVYFECLDGWYEIIWQLSFALETLIEHQILYGYQLNNDDWFHVLQVKEKFGGLRFYMTGTTEGMDKVINNFEALSKHTCEVCGMRGAIRCNNQWLECRCEDHK